MLDKIDFPLLLLKVRGHRLYLVQPLFRLNKNDLNNKEHLEYDAHKHF